MSKRDAYFDNVKFLLISFVVFGHLIRVFIDDNMFLDSIYKLIYTFHMPAFILISGYFAKEFRQKGYITKITKKILIPYFIFQAIYAVYDYFLYGKEEIVISVFKPEWSLWFLLSLFFWNLFLYLFTKIKYPIILALILGILVGYFESAGTFLSISRTFVFFPVFLLGFYLQRDHFKKLISPGKRVASMLIFACLWLAIYYIFPDFDKEWLFGSKSYQTLGTSGMEAGMLRVLFYGISLLGMAAFFSLVPDREFMLTKVGTRTFYVYLLHGFFVKYFKESAIVDWMKEMENYYVLIAFLAIGLTMFLSSKPVLVFSKPLIELKLPHLKKLAEFRH